MLGSEPLAGTITERRDHVVIVGWTSVPGELRDHFTRLCSGGCAAEIPEEVRLYLIERRNKSAIPGVFWQRRGTS